MPIRHVLALVALFFVLYLPGLGSVPPLDRDEPRFMQASKQMLETGDFVDIRFQDEARYKKPALIYWLQAASVDLFAGGDTGAVWAYRLPSVLGAVLAVLLTYGIAAVLASEGVAILAAVLLATTILLTAEAHIAKTDAMLLAAICAGQFALASLYLGRWRGAYFFLFWGALAAGLLLKGPVALAPALATVLGLGLWDRSLVWAKPLRPLLGVPFMLLFFVPWLIAIIIKSDGQFLQKALVEDMLNKVGSGQESHGAPPGYYLGILALTFWPASLFLLPAGIGAWRARAEKSVRFLICWIVPVWLMFELVPTKLPHYTLPIFPALAILCALALSSAMPGAVSAVGSGFDTLWRRGWSWLWLLLSLVLAAAFPALSSLLVPGTFVFPPPALWCTGLCAAAVGIFAFVAGRRADFRASAVAVVIGAAGMYLLVFAAALPALKPLWVASRLATVVAEAEGASGTPVLIAGFGEPSAVFLLGTETRHGDGADAARYLDELPGALVLVEDRQRAAFLREAAARNLLLKEGAVVRGLNYSRGDPVAITIYRKAD